MPSPFPRITTPDRGSDRAGPYFVFIHVAPEPPERRFQPAVVMSHQIAPLLKTKLFVVRPQERLVVRERLSELLDQIPRRKLTLISATAGFGKTTLISDWVRRTGYPTAWVSLDEGDNAPERFFAYLNAALRTVDPTIGALVTQALELPQLPSPESLMTLIINDMATREGELLLVLDDYHVITNSAIDEALLFFLEHAPPGVHVALTTRMDPSIPLARFRGRRELVEIRADDLRFSLEEAARFFNEQMRFDLTESDLAALQSRTEGWIAGLQMAALSLQGRHDMSDFIAAFSGADRYVLDYLLEEVITRQPKEFQQVMFSLAILDRFNGSLCEAVTGCPDGRALLEHLERANLFLISLDNRREWYRYHKLFGDLLLHRLQQEHEDLIPELHRRASRWLESERLVLGALTHAQAAGDDALIASILDKYWRDMLEHGKPEALRGTIERLIGNGFGENPRLMVQRAWFSALTNRMEEVAPLLEKIDTIFERRPEDPDRREIEGHVILMRAIMARDMGDTALTAELSERALQMIPERRRGEPGYGWITAHGVILSLLGDAHHAEGRPRQAAAAFERSLYYGRSTGDLYNKQLALVNLAREAFTMGELTRALELLDEIDETADSSGGVIRRVALQIDLRAKVLFERHDIEGAMERSMAAEEQTNIRRMGGLLQSAKVRFDLTVLTENWTELDRIVTDLEGFSLSSYWERFQTLLQAMRAEYHLRTGETAKALEWAEASRARTNDDGSQRRRTFFMRRDEDLLYCQIMMALERYDMIGELSAELERDYRRAEALPFLLRARSLRALMLQRMGDPSGLDILEESLALGAPERIIRPFTRPICDLTPLFAERKKRLAGRPEPLPADYIAKIYTAVGIDAPATVEVKPRRGYDIAGQLTAREMEILQLLALGYSNRKIGEKLYVSVNTVKTHITNLFTKLDAQNRVEALARAKEADLL